MSRGLSPSTVGVDIMRVASAAVHALITGGRGFVGRHLERHLAESGDEVTIMDRPEGPDIADAPAITAIFETTRPDVIIHLAGQADVGASWTTVDETYRVNLDGTRAVLLAARDAQVSRVLTVTSADVYGLIAPENVPVNEETPFRPVSPYAASKTAADVAALQAFLGYQQDVIRVRAFTHIGPGQTPRFVAAALAERIVQCERNETDEVIVGNIDARRDFTDVRDVVRAYRTLAVDGLAGEAYNVCSGTDVPISELADRLLALSTRSLRLTQDPDLMRPSDVPILRGDNTKITTQTGWRPEIPLQQSLTDLLNDRRAQA